ncbi:hypothetical protein [Streptomyces sp. NBC_00576]|uniref:hypothetical protein n=1 Tax=Streptomyces sp. NBC_00576 TaxID=2903665 RepID=UPI002E801D53|nr:hypothetical protein [Streptomyces sp. NBC_00576]WUB76562.1 hypothetical protein OG734_44590 [Streptomyces sp. NBC_00576]
MSISSKIRSAVSGSNDSVGFASKSRLITSPVRCKRLPHDFYVLRPPHMTERAEHDGTGPGGVNRRSQVPQSIVINGGRWRDAESLHDRQATAA